MAQGMLPPLVATILGNPSGFVAAMDTVKAETVKAKGFTDTAFTGMAGIGKAALLGIGAAALLGGGAALKMGGDFQEAMTQLITGAGETEDNIGRVSRGILDMAGQVGISAMDLSKGMYMIESAGYHGAQGLQVLRAAAEGAKVGGADMGSVADAVTSILNSYSLSADKANSVTSMLVATVAAGKMHMQDLADSIGTLAPTAAATHIPLEQMLGALATMTAQGDKPADAATHLRFAMLALVGPTGAAEKAMKEVGLTSEEVASVLMTKGLAPALELVQQHLDATFGAGSPKAVAGLKSIEGGVRGMATALEAGGAHLGTFKANSEAIAAAGQAAGKDVQGWAAVQGDFNQRIDRGKEAMGALLITIGTGLIPYAEKAMDVTSGLAMWLSKNQQVALPLAAALGGVLLVAIGAYTVAMIQAAIATIAATWPVLAIIAAVALLAAGLVWAYQNVDWFRNGVNFLWKEIQILWGWLGANLPNALKAVGNFFSMLGTGAHNAVAAIGAAFSALGTWVHNVIAFFQNLIAQAQAGWAEFARHPVYWIAYLAIFIPLKLLELSMHFAGWVRSLLDQAGVWKDQMIARAVATAVGFVVGMMNEIPRLPGQLWNLLQQTISNVISWGNQMVTQGQSTASNFVNMVQNEFWRLPSQMWSIGQDIIRGVINGIWSMAGWAQGQIGSAIQGFLDGAKVAAGIHSPSALFAAEVGVPISQGVALGVRQGAPAAVSAITGMVSDMSSTGRSAAPPSVTVAGPGMDDTNGLLEALYHLLDDRLPRASFTRTAYSPVGAH